MPLVNKNHLHHVRDVDRIVGVPGKKDRHDRQMPAMLGRVLVPLGIHEVRSAGNAFQLVYFENELDLLFEAIGIHAPSLTSL